MANYSRLRKQSINVGKIVASIFYSQIKKPIDDIYMLGQSFKIVNFFKYLGFSWTSKLSLKPTVNRCLENIQRSLCKLKWLQSARNLSKDVLRKFLFAYTFLTLLGLFLFFSKHSKKQLKESSDSSPYSFCRCSGSVLIDSRRFT